MVRTALLTASISLGLMAGPALAQQSGLVNVDIKNVANNLARDLNVNVSQIPVTVQVPVGIAAAVCGVDANVLAQQKKNGDAACTANNTSQGLTQAVQRQLVKQ